jgi:DNA polymerase-1
MKVLLVDANNLAYRNFYAQNLKTKTGQNTGMVYGFINSMLSAVRDLNPDLIQYVWDPPGGSAYRLALYGLYKGNRDSQGPDFYEEMTLLKQLLTALGCTQITKPSVETDDVIGYLAMTHYVDHQVVIYSNDKDMLQLVSDRVAVYQPDKGVLNTDSEGRIPIKEQNKTIWLKPHQVADYKALVGDPSDNYPGIPGFGIGAAISYFTLNDSVQGLLDNTARLSNLRSNVLSAIINHRGMVPLWRQLATINLEEGQVPVPARPVKNQDIVLALFEQLEFNQFKALGDIIYRIGGM